MVKLQILSQEENTVWNISFHQLRLLDNTITILLNMFFFLIWWERKQDYGLKHSRNRTVDAAGLSCAAHVAAAPWPREWLCPAPRDLPIFQWLSDSFCLCRQEWFPVSQSYWDKMSQYYGSPINTGANTTKHNRVPTNFHSSISQRIQLCGGEIPKELVFCRTLL